VCCRAAACCPQVQAPFRVLNMINFLVFRVTRGVLLALEICMAAGDPVKIVSRAAAAAASMHVMLEIVRNVTARLH
jgi:hypothetical protein